MNVKFRDEDKDVPMSDFSNQGLVREPYEKIIEDDDESHFVNVKPDETKFVWIKGNFREKPDGGIPISLHERNDLHPNGGEIFVTNEPVKACLTEKVAKAISNNEVLLVRDEDEIINFRRNRQNEQRKAIEKQKDDYKIQFAKISGLTGNQLDTEFEKAWNSKKNELILSQVASGILK